MACEVVQTHSFRARDRLPNDKFYRTAGMRVPGNVERFESITDKPLRRPLFFPGSQQRRRTSRFDCLGQCSRTSSCQKHYAMCSCLAWPYFLMSDPKSAVRWSCVVQSLPSNEKLDRIALPNFERSGFSLAPYGIDSAG